MHPSTLLALALIAAASPALSAPLEARSPAGTSTSSVKTTTPGAKKGSGISLQSIENGIDLATNIVGGLNTGLDFITQHFGKNKQQPEQTDPQTQPQPQPARRQEVEESGAARVSLTSIDRGIDVGTKGVGLIDGITSVADKIKHLIIDKRGEEVHPAVLGAALAHILSQSQQGRRQDTYDPMTSGALTLDSVNRGVDVGTKGVGLIDGLTSVADKIKHLIIDKRGEEVHPAIIGAALAHLLSQSQQGRRQDTYDPMTSGALTLDSVNRGIDVGTKGVGLIDGLTSVADKIKHLIIDKRDLAAEDLLRHLLGPTTVRAREPFVVPDGSSPGVFHFPTLKNANGVPYTFHALARSLNELD